jgi:glycosyltransferase (TIGR04182 family)
MIIEKDKVCILIPTLNEAPTITGLVGNFRSLGYSHIVVMDGNSRDGTRDLAIAAGAKVLVQSGKGKGNALSEAFQAIDSPYILMLDGDGTYSPDDAEKMLVPLFEGCDQTIGNRLISDNQDAFNRLNLFGNQLLNRLFRMAQGKYLFDILSGYRGFTRESIRQLHLKETGFEIETEISAEAVRNNQNLKIVPIQYFKRPGTHTKLNPFHDGLKIVTTIYKLAKMNNPLFYFGLIGVVIMFAGIITGIYVLSEWFRQIEHLPLTVLTMLLIVVGFQIFMFGVISDMLLAYHREVISEIQQLKSSKDLD